MRSLRWYASGLGEWSAWTHQDGTAATPCRIEQTHRGYRIEIRSVITSEDVVALYLNHSAFGLADAQAYAEILLATPLPLEAEPEVDPAIVEARLRARGERRCSTFHVFPFGAEDATVCQCGAVTKGWLKHSQAS